MANAKVGATSMVSMRRQVELRSRFGSFGAERTAELPGEISAARATNLQLRLLTPGGEVMRALDVLNAVQVSPGVNGIYGRGGFTETREGRLQIAMAETEIGREAARGNPLGALGPVVKLIIGDRVSHVVLGLRGSCSAIGETGVGLKDLFLEAQQYEDGGQLCGPVTVKGFKPENVSSLLERIRQISSFAQTDLIFPDKAIGQRIAEAYGAKLVVDGIHGFITVEGEQIGEQTSTCPYQWEPVRLPNYYWNPLGIVLIH